MTRIRALAVAVLTTVAMTVTVASPASATGAGPGSSSSGVVLSSPASPAGDIGVDGASCFGGCSETVNDSSVIVMAFRNWCSGGDTGTGTTTRPMCTVDGVSQEFRWINSGSQTPPGQDWDGFVVDANWCFTVHFASWIWGAWARTYNQVGKANLYVKVSNDATAYVRDQAFGRCP